MTRKRDCSRCSAPLEPERYKKHRYCRACATVKQREYMERLRHGQQGSRTHRGSREA